MLNFDPSLYLVTHRQNMSLEKFKDIIVKALKGGVTTLQLREKEISFDEFVSIGREVKELLSSYDVPLIINDNPEVAKAINADGIHVGQSDLSIEHVRNIVGEKAIVGLSVETMEQALLSKSLPVDYISISPIFATPTKTNTKEPWGLEKTRDLRNKFSKTLVAIGGICEDNIKEVMQTGIDGVCVVSAIFSAENPREAAIKLKQIIDHEKI